MDPSSLFGSWCKRFIQLSLLSRQLSTHRLPAAAQTDVVHARCLLVVAFALVVREEDGEAGHRRELGRPAVSSKGAASSLDLVLCPFARVDDIELLRRLPALGV